MPGSYYPGIACCKFGLRSAQSVDAYSQGEASPAAPLKYAEKLKQHLVNAKDGCRLYVVKGRRAFCHKYRSDLRLVQGQRLA